MTHQHVHGTDVETIAMSSLKSRLLGHYDFDKALVFVLHHPNRDLVQITHRHESFHHEMSLVSSYGHLVHSVFLARQRSDQKQKRDAYTEVISHLGARSVGVQEAGATFYSLDPEPDVDSIVEDILPEEYIEAFTNMGELVNRVFPLVHPSYGFGSFVRCEFARFIVRLSMSCFQSVEQLNTIPESTPEADGLVGVTNYPDTRYAGIASALTDSVCETLRNSIVSTLKDRSLESVLRAHDLNEVYSASSENHQKTNAILALVQDCFIGAMCPLLTNAFPSIRDEWSTSRMVLSLAKTEAVMRIYVPRSRLEAKYDKQTGELLENASMVFGIRTMLDDRYCLDQGRTYMAMNLRYVPQLVTTALRSFGVAFGYGCVRRGESSLFVVGCADVAHPGVIEFCPLERNVCAKSEGYAPDWLWIVDEGVTLDTSVSFPPNSRIFVHLRSNPAEFLAPSLSRGEKFQYTTVKIDYRGGIYKGEHGMWLTVLWKRATGSEGPLYFFLATPAAAGALETYARMVLESEDTLAYEAIDSLQFPVHSALLGLLGDHPVLCNWLCRATSPDI